MTLLLEEIERHVRDSYELPNKVLHSVPEPLVTVRILTYQHGPFIKECLQGVLMQDVSFPMEIVIGEDCSDDGTREMVFEYAKKYPHLIRVITADHNVGIKANSLRCNRAARGKYIALCEGDDCWTDSSKLAKQVDFLEKNPDYVVSYHNARVVNTRGSIVSSSKLPWFWRRDFSGEELILRKCWVLTLSIVYRNILPDLVPETVMVVNGDDFLCSLLGHYGKGKYHADIEPAVYHVHGGGIWSTLSNQQKAEAKMNTFYWIYQYYERMGMERYSNYYKQLFLMKAFSHVPFTWVVWTVGIRPILLFAKNVLERILFLIRWFLRKTK